MNEEELALVEKYKRLSPGSRRIVLAQVIAALEGEEQSRRQYGFLSGGGYQDQIPVQGIRLS